MSKSNETFFQLLLLIVLKGTSKNSRKWKIQNERSRLSAPDFPKI
jgi:hypothetical protein